MTDILTNLLASRESRALLIEWWDKTGELLKAIDRPPDGQSPVSLFKLKPEPEEKPEDEDKEKLEDAEDKSA